MYLVFGWFVSAGRCIDHMGCKADYATRLKVVSRDLPVYASVKCRKNNYQPCLVIDNEVGG